MSAPSDHFAGIIASLERIRVTAQRLEASGPSRAPELERLYAQLICAELLTHNPEARHRLERRARLEAELGGR
jgi:hypothetical protein